MINPDASKVAIAAKNFIYFVDAWKEKRGERLGFTIIDFEKADDFDRYKWKVVQNGITTPYEMRIQPGDYNSIVEAILAPELTPGYIYKGSSLASRTRAYREEQSRPVLSTNFIFLGYRANPNIFWVVEMNTLRPTNYGFQKLHIQAGSPIGEFKFDKQLIKEWLEKEDPTAKIESLFEAIENFAFIEDVDFVNGLIMLKYKPVRMDMGMYKNKAVKLRWDSLTMMINLGTSDYNRMYMFTNKSNQHPHIQSGGGVCFGTFGSYIQQNKDDIESVIVNMFEHISTYNPNSNFSRPRGLFNTDNGNLTGEATSRKEVDREFLKVRRGDEEMEIGEYINRIKGNSGYKDQLLFQ